jgi:hypothetical protein
MGLALALEAISGAAARLASAPSEARRPMDCFIGLSQR